MILSTYHTPSHREMCERFVISRSALAGFERCIPFEVERQRCHDGHYNSEGFADVCSDKCNALANVEIGADVCFVDADCVLFPGLADWCKAWLERNPDAIGFGDDKYQLCMGTIVWRQTERTRYWFSMISTLAWMFGVHDQNAMGSVLACAKRTPVGIQVLDSGVFCNYSGQAGFDGKPWDGRELVLPPTCLCWHANFCKGVERKAEMLGTVAGTLIGAKDANSNMHMG